MPYKLGDRVILNPKTTEQYEPEHQGRVLVITHVHPNFPDRGQTMYSFNFEDGESFGNSLFHWEMLRVD